MIPQLPARDSEVVAAHNAFIRAFHNGTLNASDAQCLYIRCVECGTDIENKEDKNALFLRLGFGAHIFYLSVSSMDFAERLRDLCAPWTLDDLPKIWARAALRHVLEEATRAFIAHDHLRLLEIAMPPRTKPLRLALDIIIGKDTTTRRLIMHTDADFPFMEFAEKLGIAHAEKLWPPRLTMRFPLHLGRTELAPALLADLRAGDVVFVE